MLGIVAVGVVRESRKCSGHPCRPYRAHCAVIFAIAQLSCLIELSHHYLINRTGICTQMHRAIRSMGTIETVA